MALKEYSGSQTRWEKWSGDGNLCDVLRTPVDWTATSGSQAANVYIAGNHFPCGVSPKLGGRVVGDIHGCSYPTI